MAKIEGNYPGTRMCFRSGTTAENLDGFSGNGIYTSESRGPAENLDGFSGNGIYTSESRGPMDSTRVLHAVRTVWASLPSFRNYVEREYRFCN